MPSRSLGMTVLGKRFHEMTIFFCASSLGGAGSIADFESEPTAERSHEKASGLPTEERRDDLSYKKPGRSLIHWRFGRGVRGMTALAFGDTIPSQVAWGGVLC
jgi:hypothetical protein